MSVFPAVSDPSTAVSDRSVAAVPLSAVFPDPELQPLSAAVLPVPAVLLLRLPATALPYKLRTVLHLLN